MTGKPSASSIRTEMPFFIASRVSSTTSQIAPLISRRSSREGTFLMSAPRVADRLQIAGDDFVERRSFRAGDLDDAVSRRCEGHLGDYRSNVVRRDGLEQ